MRFPALGISLLLAKGRIPVLVSLREKVYPMAIVHQKGLNQLKNALISSGIEPVTFRLVAQCLN
jgi:hypothetical protein